MARGLLYLSLTLALFVTVWGSCAISGSKDSLNKDGDVRRSLQEDESSVVYILACCADEKVKSSCTAQTAYSVRITPVEYNAGVEMLVDKCSLSYKKFKQSQRTMFVAKVCSINNIKNLSKSEWIEKIEGGTKTTRSQSFIRQKPKILRAKRDCGGGCCRECEEQRIRQVTAIPATDLGLTLIQNCAIGNKPFVADAKLLPQKNLGRNGTASGDVYIFKICKNDKHILKKSGDIANFSKLKNTFPTHEPTKPPSVRPSRRRPRPKRKKWPWMEEARQNDGDNWLEIETPDENDTTDTP